MRAIRCCWLGFKWTVVLAVVVGAVAVVCLYRRVDEEIRRRVESQVSRQLPGLKVGIRAAQRIEGRGIQIRDLSISEPGTGSSAAELLHVDEAVLECDTDWRRLVLADVPVRRVILRRPMLHLVRRSDGTWNAARLFCQKGEKKTAEVLVENGTIEITDATKGLARPLVLRDVNMTVCTARDCGTGAPPVVRRIKGNLAADSLRRLEFEGAVEPAARRFSISGQADGLGVSPEMFGTLPEPLAASLRVLGDLRGEGSLRFDVGYDPGTDVPLKFDLCGRLRRGRLDDARLPHGLNGISATVRINNDGLAVEDLSARSGAMTLRMACRRSGFGPGGPMHVSAELRQLELDAALVAALPPSLQAQWTKYRPAGRVDADVKLDYDGRTWRQDVKLNCLDVSFAPERFPYRLEHGRGTAEWNDDSFKLGLTAYSGSRPVRLMAAVARPFSGATGFVEVTGDDLQVDEALISAVPESHRKVIRALDPRGKIHVYFRSWREEPHGPTHRHLILGLNRCWLCYEKFPYSLAGVYGTIEMLDDSWTFRDLAGVHNSAVVTCEGRLTPGPQGPELALSFRGRDVPLEEELCEALSPPVQEVWRDMRPRGVVDLAAEVRFHSGQKRFSIAVEARPQRDVTSIEPVRVPYRLDHLQGVLRYCDGHLTFEGFKAEHGPVRVAAEGTCDFLPDGGQWARWDRIAIDRLRADRELIQALPERLRKVLTELRPGGPMNLRGSLEISRSGRRGDPLQWRWDARAGLQHGSLQCGGVALENVCGEVWLAGQFDGQRLRSRGELAVDSLSYKECQCTQVAGPIWIDDERVLLGAWVDRLQTAGGTAAAPARPPRSIVANLFGGKLYCDGWAVLGANPHYAISVTLTDANLASCAQEVTGGRQRLQGRVFATADVRGAGWSRNSLAGRGMVRLSEANVYELPVMISLLKILSIRPPDQRAFSDATMDYRIEGEHIYLDRIDFHGDAISLKGKGEMDFQSAIRLTFYALVGRGELDIPLVKQIFRGASQQLMLIHVGGTLQNPDTRREALPVVSHTFQQIRDELQNRK